MSRGVRAVDDLQGSRTLSSDKRLLLNRIQAAYHRKSCQELIPHFHCPFSKPVRDTGMPAKHGVHICPELQTATNQPGWWPRSN